MAAKFQLVMNALDPEAQCRFWSAALGYVVAPPPAGFETWGEFWRDFGLDEDEDTGSVDRLVDPDGVGPPIWFQMVAEPKLTSNRMHMDIAASGATPATGRRTMPLAERRGRVDAKVAELVELGASLVQVHEADGIDHYAVTLQDPEGNEFCVN